MNEPTEHTLRQHRIRFELIFASVWLALGFFFLPALIFWVGITLLGPYGEGQGRGMGTFYGDFFADLARGEFRTWALALGPLILVSVLRAIFIGRRTKPDAIEAATPPSAAPRPAESRRVEPRIGTD